jgi:putative ABC transport system ATP-binding protein
MIELDDITLTFPDGDGVVTAIDHASLAVERGTIAAITGPSGSGKSSLLAVVSALIAPQSGRVLIDDVDAGSLTKAEKTTLRRERIGIVFQQSNLLPSLTALEQLEVMAHLGRLPTRAGRAAIRRKAEDLLVAVGLDGKQDAHPKALSGGQRQRVNIARALMNDASVLVVDEPTSALDQERGAAIIDLILEMSVVHNTATLLVTHDLSHLPKMHAVYGMVDGVLTPTPALIA